MTLARSPLVVHALLVFAFSLQVLPAPARAQGDPAARNPSVDSIFAAWDRSDSPGCALGVYRDGQIIYSRGYGMADLERSVPITPHTVFDLGSTSKQFAAASILLLAQQGKLTLDDDVRRHVPELPAYSRPITIRHLLHHTSGLRDYIGLLLLAGERIDNVTTPEDALTILARQKELNFEPGDEHLYSNSGYFLLSYIVEHASGQSLRDFARSQIFEPLGMTRTHYLGSYDDIVPDRAMAYEPRADGRLRTDISRWLQLGDGAVFSTVEELLLWDRNFYDPKVGGEAMIAELQTPGNLTSGRALTYALGLAVGEHRGQRTVSHGGAWGGYRAELLRFPEQRFSVATLCNLATTNPSTLARRVADVYLSDVLAPAWAAAAVPSSATATQSVAVPKSVLTELAGTYRNPSNRALRTIVLENGKLFLTGGGPRFELQPRNATDFVLIGPPVSVTLTFEPATQRAGEPRRLRWTVSDQEPLLFDRLELVAPTAAELVIYTGNFASDELQATYTLEVVDGTLTARHRGSPPMQLRPLTRDEFSAGPVTVRFTRDATGQISGFVLDQGRIRNLRFERSRG